MRYSSTMTHIGIDDDVTSIADYVFHRMHDIMEVVLPDCLQGIGEMAFAFCTSLMKIDLVLHGLLAIGNGGFWSCSSLPTIHIPGTHFHWH
jgi:hypothetical protein